MPGLIARLLPFLFLLLALTTGCASHSEIRAKMVDDVRRGQLDSAMARLKDIGSGEGKDRIMDFMDMAMILHRQGDYQESNTYLDKAKRTLDKLYGTSVSDTLGAIFWNESAQDFVGEEFEKVFILTLGAMNYAAMGDMGAAAVEARQAQHKLTVYADILKRNKVKTSYKDDAFAWYLAGLCYEAIGEAQDALFAYRKSLQAYRKGQRAFGIPIPASLPQSILALARSLSYKEVEDEILQRFPKTKVPDILPDQATLVVFVGVGEVAHKVSRKWLIPDLQGDLIGVTYPEFRRGNFNGAGAVVTVNGQKRRTRVTQDLSTLAINTLNEKNDQIKGAAVARAMARYAAKKALRAAAEVSENSTVQVFSLLTNVALNVVDIVEVADTRSWMTLPDHYQMTRFHLPAGSHEVQLNFLSRYGMVYDQQLVTLDLKAGETRFLVAYGHEGKELLPAPKHKAPKIPPPTKPSITPGSPSSQPTSRTIQPAPKTPSSSDEEESSEPEESSDKPAYDGENEKKTDEETKKSDDSSKIERWEGSKGEKRTAPTARPTSFMDQPKPSEKAKDDKRKAVQERRIRESKDRKKTSRKERPKRKRHETPHETKRPSSRNASERKAVTSPGGTKKPSKKANQDKKKKKDKKKKSKPKAKKTSPLKTKKTLQPTSPSKE